MNRANQQRLFQQANQLVINIRQTELNYYINLFTVFGTNAALIGGFTYGILTQNIIAYSSKEITLYKYCYYVLAAMTIASSVHVIITTMLVQVYGPGLALHGPLGSMALAAEGMKQEQKQIISAVIFMVSCFAGATIWLFYCVMSFYQAIAATIVFFIAIRQWYYFCERIYLRFYWKQQDALWNGGAGRESRFSSEDQDPANFTIAPEEQAPKPTYSKKKLKFSLPFGFGKKSGADKDEATAQDIEMEDSPGYGGVLGYIFRNPATMSDEQRNSITSNTTMNTSATRPVADLLTGAGGAAKGYVIMEGYFTTRGRSEQQVLLEARRWERLYFVLHRTGDFYIYKSRHDFRQKPKSPIYTRPLRLIDFFVKIDNTDEETRSEFEDDGRTVMSAATTVRNKDGNSSKPPAFRFQITLIPRENEEYDARSQFRNHWLLRCDTEEELEIWLGAIKDVCPTCFRE